MPIAEEITRYLTECIFSRKVDEKKDAVPKTSSKMIYIDGIGDVVLRKNRLNRRTRITIKPPGIVKVTLPSRESYANAEKFVKSQKCWILENLERVKSRQKPKEIIVNYNTRHHVLCLAAHKSTKIRCSVNNGEIMVYYPETADICDDYIQNAVRKSIDKALKLEAEAYLPKRTEQLALKTGIKYSELTLVKSKRYWGMCMSDNSIKLNIHLMRLPEELIDYVILHELAHIREKNHSPRFYEYLSTLVPDPKTLRQKIKKYSPTRYM